METIFNEIKKKAKSGICLGLDNIKSLCAELGNIQNTLKFVHVAGTNGKGSVCAFCESVLSSANVKVGCYTSPCVFEKLEQFRIGGENCSDDSFKKAAIIVLNAVDRLNGKGIFPSEFEIETAIAFELFYLEECEICVIECGMGGLSDATNIIENTLISVFSPIACDHAAFLGSEIGKIAENKCGIIKNNSIVLSACQSDKVKDVIIDSCIKHQNKVFFVDNSNICNIKLKESRMSFEYKNNEFSARLIGLHQAENAALCVEICRTLANLGYNITDENIKSGIFNAKNNGRFEILSQNPLVICDGAHNPHGACALVNSAKSLCPNTQFTIVMGVFKDKDYDGILSIVSQLGDDFLAISLEGERGLDALTLAENAKRYFKTVRISNLEDISRHIAENNKAFCVCGSLSYLSNFKKCYYKYHKIEESRNG